MTLTIQNADNALTETIKQIINLVPNAKYKLQENDESGYSDEFVAQIKKESAELDEQIKNGTAKRFKSAREAFEDMGIYE